MEKILNNKIASKQRKIVERTKPHKSDLQKNCVASKDVEKTTEVLLWLRNINKFNSK